ncbi:MAG: serine/threonine-protein kinase [Pirellulaceae bacterium]
MYASMERESPPNALGPTDPTLDAPFGASYEIATARPAMYLVEGSGPEATYETQCLLRSRLRVAAYLIFGGLAVFLLWHLLWLPQLTAPLDYSVLGLHAAVTLLLGGVAASLTRKCGLCTRSLRMYELVIFGLPAVFFALNQAAMVSRSVDATAPYLPAISPPWLLLIFTYALFIPNTWRRAAIVVGIFAAMPVLLDVLITAFHPLCRTKLATNFDFHMHLVLILSVGGMAAVVGVHTINSLRNEAFLAKQLGQYKLRHLIGAGGMGEVYLGEHQLMKRPCAIKVIRPEKAGDPKTLARFEREVETIAGLSHWNSIDIYDYGRTKDGTFYYVMEYLPGMNLQELVQRFGPLPPERVIHLLTQTCDALHEAHDAGLLHRDIKPANIFAARRGGVYDVAKLLDFGLAKPLSDAQGPQITQEGFITGSPLFMSPEQATDEAQIDARSDIYALGAVAYFLLTGRPPFENEKPLKVLIAHAHEKPAPPSSHRDDLPEDLEQVVMRCLAKDPEERFPTAVALAAALDDCQDAGRWTRERAEAWWQENAYQADEQEEVAAEMPVAQL